MTTEVLEQEEQTEEQPEEFEEIHLEPNSKEFQFDTRHRCDHSGIAGTSTSCGAQAYIRATLKDERELLFCSHHADAVEPVLKPLCSKWYSETSRLVHNRKKGSEN
jgi:hypothetical protein